jgi:hypothetical protein
LFDLTIDKSKLNRRGDALKDLPEPEPFFWSTTEQFKQALDVQLESPSFRSHSFSHLFLRILMELWTRGEVTRSDASMC